MTIKLLKQNLLQAICEGYADYQLCFYDGNDMREFFTIDKVYSHEEDGIKVYALESHKSDNKDFSALELLAEIDNLEDELPVVVTNADQEKGYAIDDDTEFCPDENHIWQIWDDGSLYFGIDQIA